MALELGRPLGAALPRQMLPLADKLKDKDVFGVSKWQRDCMDSLEALGRMQFYNNLGLKENYEIINGRFILKHYLDSGDYFDLASAISQEFQLPNYLKHYDITTKAINLLLGEFLKRPDIFRVIAKDKESTNEKIRLKTELLHSYIEQSINKEVTNKLISIGLDPNRTEFQNEEEQQKYQQEVQQKYQEFTPEAIERYMKYDYRSASESWGQAVLSNDKERFSIRELEKIEFTDMLVADRCFTHFYLTPIGYNMEVWNPINTFFHQSPENRYCENGDYVGRTFYISKAQIIDRYGWLMTRKQTEALYPEWDKAKNPAGTGYGSLFQTVMVPFQNYDDFKAVDNALGAAIGFNPLDRTSLSAIPIMDEYDNTLSSPYAFMQNDLVQVTEAYWVSQRRTGELIIENPETGEIETHLVDDTFDPKLFGVEELEDSTFKDHTEPNTVVWAWTKQIWKGLKINENHLNSQLDTSSGKRGLYVDIRPNDFQFKGDYNPFNAKLPVCGGIFNNRNGRSMAVVDLLKPYQIYYNALLNQSYGITQRNNGKFFLMDVNLLPSLKDWGGEEAYEKFMSIANTLGIGLTDSSPSNPANKGNANFSHYQVIDLDETEKVTRLINLAMLIESQGFLQLGITPQRQGQIQASETATATNAAVSNSYAITETYFENFYNYKKRKLQMHLDIAQYCAVQDNDITLPYITSDLGDAYIKMTGTELMSKDLGVYITYSSETQRQKQLAEQLLLNNTTEIPLSKLISLIRLDSLTDIQKEMEQSEAEIWKKKQEEMQHQSDMQKQALDAEAAEKQKDRDTQVRIAEIKANADLQKTTLQGIANESSFSDADLTDKLIQQRDLTLRENESKSNAYLQQQQLVNQQIDSFTKKKQEDNKLKTQKELQDKQHALDKQDMEHSLKLEDKKNEGIDRQNKSQEKIAKEQHERELALYNKKLELEELKNKGTEKKVNLELNALEKKVKIEEKLGDVKADVIIKVGKAKVQEAQQVAKIKSKEAQIDSSFKLEEKEQVHEHKLVENKQKHSLKLKIDAKKAKDTLKSKPKITKK